MSIPTLESLVAQDPKEASDLLIAIRQSPPGKNGSLPFFEAALAEALEKILSTSPSVANLDPRPAA